MSFPRYQLSGAAKAPGGSSLQEAVSAKLDDLFAEYMQLYAAVREARAQSNAQIKEGFFALAQARHHSTAGVAIAIDASAYSGRDMLASQGWSIRSLHPADPSDDLNVNNPKSVEEPLVFESVPIEYKQGEEEKGDKDEETEEAEASSLRKRGAKDADATKPAESSAASSSSDDAPAAPAPAAVDLRSAPLSWFGVLAPPQLPSVSSSFQSSLVSLASVASLAQRLTELEKKFRYLSHLQQATHVDPAAEEELASILEKIKISDAKKAAAAAAAAAPTNTKDADAAASSAATAAPAAQ